MPAPNHVRHPSLPRRPWLLAAATACALLLAASSHPGASALNALAALRGHLEAQNLAYGPLDRQRFDLYRPAAREPAAPTPLVFFVHGGTWASGDRATYRFVGEALAAEGFIVMVIDYRLYPAVRYPAFVQDTALAVAYALEHARALGADPRRVVLFGHSAGAYNAAMVALDPRWLQAEQHAPAELAGWIGLAGPYNFLPIGDPTTKLVFQWPNTAADTQPVRHVDDVPHGVPAFLGAAVEDDIVHATRNTVPLARALQQRGVPVTERLYDRVGHASLVGALAFPLTGLAPVLEDLARFIVQAPPARAG